MSKKKVLLIVLAIAIVLIAAVAIISVIALNKVRPFSLQDAYYQRFLQEFASDRTVEPVDSAKEAKRVAKEIWTEIYGADTILDEKPYLVYYDEAEDVWLVTGTLPLFAKGGVAKILIHSNGTVLAVWHEK